MTTRRALLVYAVLGVALWPVPLFNVLHVEAAAVVAFVAFFVAGWGALDAFNQRRPPAVRHVLLRQEAVLLVPLGLLTLSLLWTPNCDYARGLLFYGLFPGGTVVFAVSVAYALSGTGWRYPKAMLAGFGVGVALLGPLYDLGLHPQFYTYNHVFGGVLGPIYDEELAVRRGIFTFRGLTLLWALFFFLMGQWLRIRRPPGERPEVERAEHRGSRGEDRGVLQEGHAIFHPLSSILSCSGAHGYAAGMLVTLVFIVSCNAFAAPLGFNTPAGYLQAQLGGHLRTAHFDLYYDPASLAEHELDALAEDHEYRYAWLEERLSMDGPERVASYLYPDAATKARLTGARATSVAPVWLPRPQSHVLLDRYEASFGHELVHVFSRRFGLPVVNASWAVGLVEGLAVALEPPDGRPTPREQVSAALLNQSAEAVDTLALRVAARLQPHGFWTERGAVSYTTMGAFVHFLIDRYGAERFRAVYARANFEAVYGRPLDALIRAWIEDLRAPAMVARDAEALVSRRFTRPSLFERRCPHYVPHYRRAYRAGRSALATGDTTQAEAFFMDALHERPHFTDGHRALARLRLARGAAEAVVRQLGTRVREGYVPVLDVLLADAYVLQGRSDAARAQYEAAYRRLPRYAHAEGALVTLRAAVAAQPDVVRILASADSAHVQAARLEARSDLSPAIRVWAALRHMEAGQYDRAAAAWAALPDALALELPASRRRLLRRQILMWRARCALRRGAYAGAQDDARFAAEAFRAIGAFNLAAAAADLAEKADWAMR